jgi:hypothetical protein
VNFDITNLLIRQQLMLQPQLLSPDLEHRLDYFVVKIEDS